MKRRNLFKVFAGSVLSVFFPSCEGTNDNTKILKGYNKKGFYVRFFRNFEPVNPRGWTLDVNGQCEHPGIFAISDLKTFSKTTQTSRLKCVECWSAKAKWGGFKAETLFDIVKPKKNSKFLYISCADGYYEYIPLKDILKPRVIFVYEMNDHPLPNEHGAPLRLIIPSKYGYKNVKTITSLTFTDKGGNGYWVNNGYDADGIIKTGFDHPLDIGGLKRISEPGELMY